MTAQHNAISLAWKLASEGKGILSAQSYVCRSGGGDL